MRIILDMDEVLSDFVGGAAAIHGLSLADVLKHWTPGKWDMTRPVGDALGRPNFRDNDFWEPIHNNEGFWSGLSELPCARRIFEVVQKVSKGDFMIVTAPNNCTSSHVGKIKWLKTFRDRHFNSFAITPHKHFFANSDSVLIDDRESNCDKFIRHGGRAILYPAYHNRLHDVAALGHESAYFHVIDELKQIVADQ